MFTIFKRDFLAYFRTPVGYVFMGVFLTLSGLIFYLYNLQNLSGDLLTFLSQLTAAGDAAFAAADHAPDLRGPAEAHRSADFLPARRAWAAWCWPSTWPPPASC